MNTQWTIGIIGGSGLYSMDVLEDAEWREVTTPWGAPSDQLRHGRIGDVAFALPAAARSRTPDTPARSECVRKHRCAETLRLHRPACDGAGWILARGPRPGAISHCRSVHRPYGPETARAFSAQVWSRMGWRAAPSCYESFRQQGFAQGPRRPGEAREGGGQRDQSREPGMETLLGKSVPFLAQRGDQHIAQHAGAEPPKRDRRTSSWASAPSSRPSASAASTLVAWQTLPRRAFWDRLRWPAPHVAKKSVHNSGIQTRPPAQVSRKPLISREYQTIW